MTLRSWLCCALVAASATASADCPKCECIGEIGLLPQRDEPKDVALNARVITGTVPDPARKEQFVLRAVGGAPVAVAAETLHIENYDTLVLTPTTPLAKNTDYELVLLRDTHTIPYTKLHTSDGPDTTPPTWAGPLHASYARADSCDTECGARRGARVEITAPAPSDDRSGVDLVAVWVTSGAPIDYGKPAAGYVHVRVEDEGGLGMAMGLHEPPRTTIVVGGAGPCTKETVALPRGAKRIRVGMKVLDRAGNASAPLEVETKLTAAT